MKIRITPSLNLTAAKHLPTKYDRWQVRDAYITMRRFKVPPVEARRVVIQLLATGHIAGIRATEAQLTGGQR